MASDRIPRAHFGAVSEKPHDWRATNKDEADDDEELEASPSDVVGMLGFDPLEIKTSARDEAPCTQACGGCEKCRSPCACDYCVSRRAIR